MGIEYRIVDFAPGCPQEALAHPIWPIIQGKRVAIHATDCGWLNLPNDTDPKHTVWTYVPCDNAACPHPHTDSEKRGYGRAHRAYFRPDELRFEEVSS